MKPTQSPRVIVFSSLFPTPESPASGAFIKERLFRVNEVWPIVVVAPQPWSPFDSVLRLFRKTFRPIAQIYEVENGVEIFRPLFLSIPKIFKTLDAWLMYRASLKIVSELVDKHRPELIDAHFLYPDGKAASILAKKFNLPLTITIRGSKDEWLIGTSREQQLKDALHSATHLIAVSEALKKDVAIRLGCEAKKVTVIGNGVDLEKFSPIDKREARRKLGLADHDKVVIGVGGLIARKGFHRIIPLLPQLRQQIPNLKYLIVGGGVSHGDMKAELVRLAKYHSVDDIVHFCGPQKPQDLKWFYGAADVFALATEHEGWANVFLEAMACGLPVISTTVGGNKEVVSDNGLGKLVAFWDPEVFSNELHDALVKNWDRKAIMDYAQSNTWHRRIDQVCNVFEEATNRSPVLSRSSKQK